MLYFLQDLLMFFDLAPKMRAAEAKSIRYRSQYKGFETMICQDFIFDLTPSRGPFNKMPRC
jgi:hypothetical protein